MSRKSKWRDFGLEPSSSYQILRSKINQSTEITESQFWGVFKVALFVGIIQNFQRSWLH